MSGADKNRERNARVGGILNSFLAQNLEVLQRVEDYSEGPFVIGYLNQVISSLNANNVDGKWQSGFREHKANEEFTEQLSITMREMLVNHLDRAVRTALRGNVKWAKSLYDDAQELRRVVKSFENDIMPKLQALDRQRGLSS